MPMFGPVSLEHLHVAGDALLKRLARQLQRVPYESKGIQLANMSRGQ